MNRWKVYWKDHQDNLPATRWEIVETCQPWDATTKVAREHNLNPWTTYFSVILLDD